MAMIDSVTIYEQAAQGKRIFAVKPELRKTIEVGLRRKGYSIKTKKIGNYIEIKIL